jgi:hypothetical protein
MDATITELAAKGIDTEAPKSPDGSDDFLTSWITDPDGNRIELVQWPATPTALRPPTGRRRDQQLRRLLGTPPR